MSKKLTTRQMRKALVFGSDDEREGVKQELAVIASSDITKVTPTRAGNAIEIEMHDKVSALRMLAKHHGLLETSLDKTDRPSVIGINMTGPVVTHYEEKDGTD